MIAVLKKEFKQYFLTPIGYVYLFLFSGIVSLYFYIYAFGNSGVRYEDTLMYSSWLLIVLIPILTMKMFSEEIRNRTDTTLITSPNSIFSIVMGKFLSAFGVILVSVLLSGIYLLLVSQLGKPDLSSIMCSLVGYLLGTMAFISIGMFISSFTEHQSIAAIVTAIVLIIMNFGPMYFGVIKPFSIFSQMNKFSIGVFPLVETISLIATIITFFALTCIMLKVRKILR